MEVFIPEIESDDILTSHEIKEDLSMKSIVRIRKYLFDTYDFYHNDVTQELLFKKKGDDEWDVFCKDRKLNNIVYDLKAAGFSRPKEDVETILFSDAVKIIHPIKQYFHNLVPLNTTTHFSKLCDQIVLKKLNITFEEKNYQELFREYFLKWLIAAYFCGIGKKHNDVMFILIGPQGMFKTSFLNYLCPPALEKYRVTGHIVPSITDGSTSTFLAEKFLINIDDQMEKIMYTEYQRMKAIISASDVTSRKVYAKTFKKRTRIGNFVGSVNNPQFLVDNENRRYLCFEIETIKKTYVNVNIDKVWAEIKHISEQLPNHFVFGSHEYDGIRELNNYFTRPTDEEEILNTVFRALPENLEGIDPSDVYYMQQSEIFRVLKQYSRDTLLRSYNLSSALTKHKYIKVNKRMKRFENTPRQLYMLGLLVGEIKIMSQTGIDMVDFKDESCSIYDSTTEPNY